MSKQESPPHGDDNSLVGKILGTSIDGILLTNPEHQIVEANESFYRLFGLNSEEIAGSSLSDLLKRLKDDAFSRWDSCISRVLATGDQEEIEFRHSSEGRPRFFQVRVALWKSHSPSESDLLVSIWRDWTEQKLARRDLRVTRFAIDHAADCVLWIRGDGRLLYVNAAVCRMLGYESSELLKKTLPDVDSGFSKERWEDHWAEIGRQRSITRESSFRAKDGRKIPIDVSITYRKVGSEEYAYAVARDISGRRRADEALRLSEDRYEMATRAGRTGVWDWNVKTGEYYVDAGVKAVLGYEDAEIANDRDAWLSLIHPEDREDVLAVGRACLEGTTSDFTSEHRMLHKDGSVRWILGRGRVIRDVHGMAIRIVGTETDVTDRKQLENALHLETAYFEGLFQNSPEAVAVVDYESRVLRVNAEFSSMFGYSAEEVLGRPIDDLLAPSDLRDEAKALTRRAADGERISAETVRLAKNGIPIEVLLSGTPISAGQDSVGIHVIYRDVTGQKRAAQALTESEARYHALFDESPVALFEVDCSAVHGYLRRSAPTMAKSSSSMGDADFGRFLLDLAIVRDVNGAALRLFGANSKQELIKQTAQIWSDESSRTVGRTARDGSRDPDEIVLESIAHKVDGSPFEVGIHVSVPPDHEDTWSRVLIAVTDITERKRAEEELRKFQVIADTANYGMAITDLTGSILYVNPSFAGAHRFSADELLGENISVLHNEEQMAAIAERNAILLEDGEFGPDELWHTRKDGSTFPMLVNGVTILDDGGIPLYVAMTAIDITDRVAADDALRSSERQQAAVASLGRRALASGDLESLLTNAVKLLTETLDVSFSCVAELAADGAEFQLRAGVGWKPDSYGETIIGADLEWQGGLALREGKAIVVENVQSEDRFDEPVLFRDHHIISSVTIPIRGWGRPFGVLVACEVSPRQFDEDDINCLEGIANVLAHAIERKQAEDALATSRERLRNLAARLHAVREEERTLIAREIHDQLGQALTGLKMDLSWIMTRLPDDAAIMDRANSMLSLLDTTVNSVRTISAQLRPPILDDLGLEAAIEWQAYEFGRKSRIECHLDLHIGERSIGGDRATAAFRILQEALTNVARHAGAKNVWIEIGVVGGELRLTVSDDGRGVGDATLSSARSIGLIGMRERAGALGGRVEVRRRSKGGTTVRLELPLEQRLVGDSL